ncbi:MAG: hypothetical protein ACRCXK_04050 [Wohlfahrtiimonas sp.]
MPISTLINNAEVSKVSEGLLSAKANNFHQRYLLSPNNPLLASMASDAIKNHHISPLNTTDVKEYLAISIFAHMIDGWSYMNNAINAFLTGDPSIAIHLAYYAELRAAISFLGSEGILMVNNQQACIDSNDELYVPSAQQTSLKIKRSGTHTATWDITKEWISNHTRGDRVLEYFTYRGRTFKELIPSIPNCSATTTSAQVLLIKNWLQTWCFDIQKYKDDRDGRNASSYNANINKEFSPLKLKDRLNILNEFWLLLEPSEDCFSNLDRYLFALYLDEIYQNNIRSGINSSKEDFIGSFYQNSGLSIDQTLTDIFINNKMNSLILQASDNQIDTVTNNIKPLTIIARSILLLCFCSKACAYILKKNHIVKNDINFYISKVGQGIGLWRSEEPEQLSELWIDINDLIIDLKESLENDDPLNILDLRDCFPAYSEIYTQFSRVGLWGLGL